MQPFQYLNIEISLQKQLISIRITLINCREIMGEPIFSKLISHNLNSSVGVIMNFHSSQKHSCWICYVVVLAFIVLRTIFALVWNVDEVSAKNDCGAFADRVLSSFGVEAVEASTCRADNNYATVGHELGSYLVLDMGLGNEIIDGPGIDFYYYERLFSLGILLDQVEIAVAQDDGSENPPFIVVFIWGDDVSENNGVIPPLYNPEEPNKPIDATSLHNETGIGIDIGNDNGAAYRFVRFQTHPTDAVPVDDQVAEVDAVEGIHPPPTFTPTPILIETPSPASTPVLSDTPFDFLTATSTLPETSTDTPVETTIPSGTVLVTLALTNTATPSLTDISSITITPAPAVTFTATATFTPTNTLTVADTLIPAQTRTHTATVILSQTPIVIYTTVFSLTPSITSTSSYSYTPSEASTSTATFTPSNTLTAIATRTPIPKPTRTPTKTLFPSYIPGAVGYTAIPAKTFTATLTKVNTPTPSKIPTTTKTSTWIPTTTLTKTFTPTQMPTMPLAPINSPTNTPEEVTPRGPFSWQDIFNNIVATILVSVVSICITVIIAVASRRYKWIIRLINWWKALIRIDADVPSEQKGISSESGNQISGSKLEQAETVINKTTDGKSSSYFKTTISILWRIIVVFFPLLLRVYNSIATLLKKRKR